MSFISSDSFYRFVTISFLLQKGSCLAVQSKPTLREQIQLPLPLKTVYYIENISNSVREKKGWYISPKSTQERVE